MASRSGGLRVAVVGATGLVGRELLDLLESRRFPIGKLLVFSSGRSCQSVRFHGKTVPAPGVSWKSLSETALVFFVSSDEVSLRLAPKLAARGVWVIDDSSAFRLDPKVPLVIPEVNPSALSFTRRLIAGPNCTMTGAAVAGYPLHRRWGVREARIASYQAISGAGKAALEEFYAQVKTLSRRLGSLRRKVQVLPALKSSALPKPSAFNVFPQVGGFNSRGETSEETKVAAELKKIWGAPELKVSVTAVRVPVLRGHSLAAWFTLARPATPAQAKTQLSRAPGLRLSPGWSYPTALDCAGKGPVYAGRLRRGAGPNELCLWIVSDNLLKGAALNSVQIAEELLSRRWLTR